MKELSNVGNIVTSLKENDLLNVILYEDKNFDSLIATAIKESMIGTKTLIAIAIRVYTPQLSNLSDALDDSTNHFLSNSVYDPR